MRVRPPPGFRRPGGGRASRCQEGVIIRSPTRHREHTGPRPTAATLVGMLMVDCDGIDVALVPWPDEESALEELARAGRPRILMVAAAVPPPDVRDPLEDWVRVPVDHGDVEVRARRLARIAVARRSPANGAGRTARSGALVDADGSAR